MERIEHRTIMTMDDEQTLHVLCPFCGFALDVKNDGQRVTIQSAPDPSVLHFGALGGLRIETAQVFHG